MQNWVCKCELIHVMSLDGHILVVVKRKNWAQILSYIQYKEFRRQVYNYIIIVIIGKTAFFLAVAFLRRFCEICLELGHPVFISFYFKTILFLSQKVISLAFNPKPGGPGLWICVPQWQVGPDIPPGTGFPFRRLLRLAGLRLTYYNPPPRGGYNKIEDLKW
jgi:hypothetical protein